GWIPEDCKKRTESYNYLHFEIDVYNVTYTDCDNPWILCRHKKSTTSKDHMINIFGSMPLGMREYARHILAMPDITPD
ncbi:uncharacterized protein BCR38DRAFT_348108, partial [Pseudomassariella vexata]